MALRPLQAGSVVGFVGLGNMGAPMAINMINNSKFQVKLYDLDPKRVQYVKRNVNEPDRVSTARSPVTLAKDCGTIVTMVPDN